jgi:hypothetical protein
MTENCCSLYLNVILSGYDREVKLSRFFLIVLYMGYLVNVGLMLILLPWSRAWGRLLSELPPTTSALLDTPWLRGLLSAFGALHLMLVAWELVHPTLLEKREVLQTESQNSRQS